MKQLFDAIDGKRTLGEIAPQHSHHHAVRVLFEGLWRYDQVVFDASALARRCPTEATHSQTP